MNSFALRDRHLNLTQAAGVWAVLRSEAIKNRGSLIGLLSLAVPFFVVLVSFVVLMKQGTSADKFVPSTVAVWAYGMLPLGVAALSALVGHIEHGSRGFDQVLALPGVRRWIFAAKGVTVILTVGAWHVLLLAGMMVLAALLSFAAPDAIEGSPDWAQFAMLLARTWAASWCMCMVQLFVALWFRSFVWPLALGVFGAFAAIASMGAPEGVYFPWTMPLQVMRSDAGASLQASVNGFAGGVAVLAIMALILPRRRW